MFATVTVAIFSNVYIVISLKFKSLSMGQLVGFLLFEYTLYQTQNKATVIIEEIKKTELQSDRT